MPIDNVNSVGSKALGRIPKAKRPKVTPEEQRAKIERVAREHGVDLRQEGFNAVPKSIGRPLTVAERNVRKLAAGRANAIAKKEAR